MENTNNAKALFIILNAGFADDVMETAREAGIRGATIIHARGSGAIKAFMGITIDTEKEIIFSVANSETAKKVMLAIKEKHGMSTPAHCISFLMPVDSTAGIPAITSNEVEIEQNRE